MAKKSVATLRQKDITKGVTKVIKMVKSKETGAYSFREDIMAKDFVKEFFEKK